MAEKDNIVFETTLDDRFECTVTRTKPYRGTLSVVDRKTNKTIMAENVRLMNDAIFGADAWDIEDWQEKVVEFIDNEYDHQ